MADKKKATLYLQCPSSLDVCNGDTMQCTNPVTKMWSSKALFEFRKTAVMRSACGDS